MEDLHRLFIALELPDSIRRWLVDARAQLMERIPPGTIRWVDSGAIHLTMKFLGEVPARRTGEICASMDGLVRSLRPFSLTAGGLGCFPSTARPRVVWAGIRGGQMLGSLQQSIEQGLERIGFPAERRAFSPHLTLGRVKDGLTEIRLGEIGRAVEGVSLESTAGMDAKDVCLYRSILRPGGPEYSVLHRAQFSG